MDNFIIFLTYIGLLCGALRIIPQTILTIKTKAVKNLPITFFSFQIIAAILGISYEVLSHHLSVPHVLFFAMLIITNLIQVIYMRFFCD